MFRNKITRKMTLYVSLSLILVITIVLVAQLFIINRNFMNSEYNQQQASELFGDISLITDSCGFDEEQEAELESALNRYASNNRCCCFILNEAYEIVNTSYNFENLDSYYIDYTLDMFLSNKIKVDFSMYREIPDIIFPDQKLIFQIYRLFKIPTMFRGLYYPVSITNEQSGEVRNIIFIAITKDVYMAEFYLILQHYGRYLFIFIIIITITFSAFFSCFITRPIINIEKATSYMINMDFSRKCRYKANDELGRLSESINFLSEKLEHTICQLKDANNNLQNELNNRLELDEMRKNFIASVSHEFKTPLTLIRGYLEIMEEDRLSNDQRKYAEKTIIEEIDRLDKMVLDLLELTKLESGACDMHMEHFDICGLLQNIADKYRITMENNQINFCVKINEDSLPVYADKNRIEQVIFNFLSNAIKFTAKQATIILCCQKENDCVVTSVFNEGIKIRQEDLKRIWHQFYQSDKSRARKSGGSGLGLSICREILEKHGSSYGAENVDGGVRFFFTLDVSENL